MIQTDIDARNDVVEVPPQLVATWLDAGEAMLVDVREDFEHANEHIHGAVNTPQSRLDADQLRRRCGARRLVLVCRSGRRSTEAAAQFVGRGQPVFHLTGGLLAWKEAGLPTQRAAGAPRIDVMRQTQIVIGALVLAGVLPGAFLSPWFLIISGIMGIGLIFAGASGTCGMAVMLARMPWNRISAGCAKPATQTETDP